MAKARANLKGMSQAADRLVKDLKNLRKTPASGATRTETTTLHRKLTQIRTLLNACPDTMFRLFEMAEPVARKRRRTKTARKTTRKGARKSR